jgi:hypothetical protein
MPARPKTRPVDPNQLAHNVFLESIGEQPKTDPNVPWVDPDKNPAAVALGRLGGAKGGAARAAALSPRKRSAIAKKAAQARWSK